MMFRYVHFQQFDANPQGRDFVLGDLHGCYAVLQTALAKVGFDKTRDRLFSVGDLVDRGPDSLACLELLNEPWFFAVQGNHENMMMGGIKAGKNTPPWQGWMDNGGSWYVKLTATELERLGQLLPQVARLPITCIITTRSGYRIGISHAQPPIMDWSNLNETSRLTGDEIWRAMWGRTYVREKTKAVVAGVDVTFHGHTIVKRLRQVGNMHYIDTGAYMFDQISLIELTDEFVKQSIKVA